MLNSILRTFPLSVCWCGVMEILVKIKDDNYVKYLSQGLYWIRIQWSLLFFCIFTVIMDFPCSLLSLNYYWKFNHLTLTLLIFRGNCQESYYIFFLTQSRDSVEMPFFFFSVKARVPSSCSQSCWKVRNLPLSCHVQLFLRYWNISGNKRSVFSLAFFSSKNYVIGVIIINIIPSYMVNEFLLW